MLSSRLSLPASVFFALPLCGQYGPNSPGSASNDASVGSNAWAVPANALVSDDSHATVSARGLSNYLRVDNFEFNLPTPGIIQGIQLDVEKSTLAPLDASVLDNWTSGLTKSISTGSNRCLVVVFGEENGTTSRDLTAVSYGGRAMTPIAEMVVGGGAVFSARVEAWMLLESEIALASSTAIVPTYGSYSPVEYCEAFSAVVFQNVDQLAPVSSLQTSGAIAATNPHQLGAAISTLAGSIAVNAVVSGNNTTPEITDGGTDTYTINSGFTEGTDIYFANTAVAPTSGACMETAHKPITANGTEQPACTFNGGVNRHVMIGFTLQRARELDLGVVMSQSGSLGGTNNANPLAWPTADAYVTYGGPTDLWGRSWTVADINDPGFGAAVSALVQNGTARVDHMRISVYEYVTLPIELLDFRGRRTNGLVRLDWVTATEKDNDHFIVQHSRDGVSFEDLVTMAGAGNSSTTRYYHAVDEHPWPGLNLYRLKQVDFDGQSTLSNVVTVNVERQDLTVFPNPTADGVITVYDSGSAPGQVAVYDEQLRLVRTHYIGLGSDPILHIGDLPDGTYVLMVPGPDGQHASRVVKTSREK